MNKTSKIESILKREGLSVYEFVCHLKEGIKHFEVEARDSENRKQSLENLNKTYEFLYMFVDYQKNIDKNSFELAPGEYKYKGGEEIAPYKCMFRAEKMNNKTYKIFKANEKAPVLAGSGIKTGFNGEVYQLTESAYRKLIKEYPVAVLVED